jgi:predicted  nucleic acid-binding Zn-ribbon protein
VELSKLKLIKQNAIKNLEKRIQNIKNKTSGNNTANQIDKYNNEIASLDSKILNINQRIDSMKKMKQKRPSQGEFN